MSAKQLIRPYAILIAILLTPGVVTAFDKKTQANGQTPLTIRKIIELASDRNRDGVSEILQQLSVIYSDVPPNERHRLYGIDGAKMLADGAVITNALFGKPQAGRPGGLTIELSRVGCYPLGDALSAAYMDGPYYTPHSAVRYVRETLWIDMGIFLRGNSKCVDSIFVSNPNKDDSYYKSLYPIDPDSNATAGSMDDIFNILAGNDNTAIQRVKSMLAAGYANYRLKSKSADLSGVSLLADGMLVDYAHQYAPNGKVYAIEMSLSDEPCYPLWRALKTTEAVRSDDAESGEAYKSTSGRDLKILPHLRSPNCVGWVAAALLG